MYRQAPPPVQVREVVAVAAPRAVAATGSAAPRQHAVSCLVVLAAGALQPMRRTRSKLCLWASDRPLRGRPEPLRRRDRRVAGAARARAVRAGGR